MRDPRAELYALEERFGLLAKENYTLKRQLDDERGKADDLAIALQFYAQEHSWNMAWRNDIRQYVPANSEGTSLIEEDKYVERQIEQIFGK